MNDTIWMYWEDLGRPKPAFYALCQETVRMHNPNTVRIINRKEAEDLIGKIPAEFDDIHIVHRVDWIRKMLLWKFGGMYLDSDFICFENLDSVLNLSRTFDFVGYKEWGRDIMDNIAVAKAGSILMREAADIALETVMTKKKGTKWLDTNAKAMEKAFEKLKWKCKWILLPTHLVSPTDCCNPKWFLEKTDNALVGNEASCLGYITSFNMLGDWAKNSTRKEILQGKERVCHIMRHAFLQTI